MDRTRLRYVEPLEPAGRASIHSLWSRYSGGGRQYEELSSRYDAFVAFVHKAPPCCYAPRGVLVVLFPIFDPWGTLNTAGGLSAGLRRRYLAFEWQRRLASYKHIVAISKFACDWTRERWKVDSGILYPPVDLGSIGVKEDLILSVSRFTPRKRQLEMVAAFRQLSHSLPQGWALWCAGGLDDSAQSLGYFERVQEAAVGACVHYRCNVGRAELTALYRRAKIFWHAMGFLEDSRFPWRMEHFGIVTVEAMSAGCVPVVFDGGGQRELVRHGIDGFRWKTVEELQEYTQRLVDDGQLRAAMSQSAATRAAEFGKSSYLKSMSALIEDQRG